MSTTPRIRRRALPVLVAVCVLFLTAGSAIAGETKFVPAAAPAEAQFGSTVAIQGAYAVVTHAPANTIELDKLLAGDGAAYQRP